VLVRQRRVGAGKGSGPDETLIRALARAHRWKRMIEAGKCRSIAEIADAEKIGRSFIGSRLLRLTLLAPDIQEAILEGRQPKGMQLEELMRAMPAEWGSSGNPAPGVDLEDKANDKTC
jgi:hypothetical protein